MSGQNNEFQPLTKACAFLGAAICFAFSVSTLLSSFFAFSTIEDLFLGISRSALLLYLAWCFWYAGKFEKNPFSATLLRTKS